MMHRLLVFLLAFLCLLPCFAWAQNNNALLEVLRRQAQDTQTISSSFTQEKHLAVFNDIVTSTGSFIFQRPYKLRWEYHHPFRSGFMLNGESGKKWDDLTGSQDVHLANDPIMRIVAEQVLAWTTFDLDALQRQYDITITARQPVTLRLTPKSSALRAIISHLCIVFSDDAQTITIVELHDKDGDFTRLSFHDTLLNPELPEEAF